jgi:putative protein kinase ArgK-like GTPase of G3E family
MKRTGILILVISLVSFWTLYASAEDIPVNTTSQEEQTLDSNFSNPNNLTDQQMYDAKNFNHTGFRDRKVQDKYWLTETLKEMILSDFFEDEKLANQLRQTEDKVVKGEISSFHAAEMLYELFKQTKK